MPIHCSHHTTTARKVGMRKPTWAAICLTFSRLPVFLFPFVSYHVETAIVLAGVVLLFIGSIPATLAVLSASHNDKS